MIAHEIGAGWRYVNASSQKCRGISQPGFFHIPKGICKTV